MAWPLRPIFLPVVGSPLIAISSESVSIADSEENPWDLIGLAHRWMLPPWANLSRLGKCPDDIQNLVDVAIDLGDVKDLAHYPSLVQNKGRAFGIGPAII
jgi:hypothetical protein